MTSERRREICKKHYDKIRNDPERWAARLKLKAKYKPKHRRVFSDKQRERINYLQRKKKQQMSPEERERALEKRRAKYAEAWAKIPHDDPRRAKRKAQSLATYQRYGNRSFKRLSDSAVANYYLRMRVGECPKELIELAREVLRLTRRLKNHPNNNK